MKKIIKMKEVVILSLEEKEDKINVMLNGAKFIYEDGVIKEIDQTATVEQFKEIEAKYTKQEDGTYSEADIDAMQKEVKEYDTYKEVVIIAGTKNVIEEVKELEKLMKDN